MNRGSARRATLALFVAFATAALGARAVWAQDSLEASKRRELESIKAQAQEKRDAARKLLVRENAEISALRRTDRQLNSTRQRLRGLEQRRRTIGQDLQST